MPRFARLSQAVTAPERLPKRRAASHCQRGRNSPAVHDIRAISDLAGPAPLQILTFMKALVDALADELERPRDLTEQALQHLLATYGLEREAAGDFLIHRLPELEDYEIDLILSPLFAPAIHDQAIFAELLGAETIPAEQWPGLVQQLVARPTRAQIVAGEGQRHPVPLRDVTIERYVKRLRLNGTIPDALFRLISNLPPPAVRPLLKAVARRAIWDEEARSQILLRYLTATAGADDCRLDDALQLLQLMETYEPIDGSDLLSRIPHWEKRLKQEIGMASNPKPFFDERTQEVHRSDRDRHTKEEARIAEKQREIEFLERLRKLLESG